MSDHPDGGSTTSTGAYAPPSRTISVKEALARCDRQQAEQIRKWAERIEAAVAAADKVDPQCSYASDFMQIANEMKNAAFIVERFTEDLFDKIGGG